LLFRLLLDIIIFEVLRLYLSRIKYGYSTVPVCTVGRDDVHTR